MGKQACSQIFLILRLPQVSGVYYSGSKKALLTASEDSHLVVWDMAIRRDQVRAISLIIIQ